MRMPNCVVPPAHLALSTHARHVTYLMVSGHGNQNLRIPIVEHNAECAY